MNHERVLERIDRELSGKPTDSEPEQQQRRRFKLVSADEVMTPKPHDWLIRNFIERGSLGLLFGDPASGKSLLTLDWALSISLGAEWRGQPTNRGLVAYIQGEGFSGQGRRLKALEVYTGRAVDPGRLFFSSVAAELISAGGIGEVLEAVAELPEPPVMIVLDTLHRNMGPGDENSAADFGAFLNSVDMLRDETGAAILIVHHAGHGDKTRARGSSSIRAAVDVGFSLTKTADGITLECTKSKDFEPPEPLGFEIEPVSLPWADDEGQPIDGVVLAPAAVDTTPAQRRLTPRDRIGIETLAEALTKHGRLPPADVLQNNHLSIGQTVVSIEEWRRIFYARVPIDGDSDARKKAFQRVRNSLTARGDVVIWGDFAWHSLQK